MTYRIITTYQDGGEIKTHVETGHFQGTGINGVLSIRRKHITDTGGIEIKAGEGYEWITLSQICKVRVEPIAMIKDRAKGRERVTTGGGG